MRYIIDKNKVYWITYRNAYSTWIVFNYRPFVVDVSAMILILPTFKIIMMMLNNHRCEKSIKCSPQISHWDTDQTLKHQKNNDFTSTSSWKRYWNPNENFLLHAIKSPPSVDFRSLEIFYKFMNNQDFFLRVLNDI